MAGLEALGSGDASLAIEHLETAMTWPEHLGQGRPYEPEERLERYLLGVAHTAAGDAAAAREAFERVVAATPSEVFVDGASSRLDVLAAAALDALGRGEEAGALRTSLRELMATRGEQLSDVEGRLIHQALEVAPVAGR